jgi:hypothetical protein
MNKNWLVLAAAVLFLLVGGLIENTLLGVELKTEPGEKLIDLDKVIDGIGKTGNAYVAVGEGEEETEAEEEEEEIDPLDAVTIKVDFTDIYLENSLCTTTEILRSRLSSYSDLKKAILMDDYAEAHVLRGVWKTLEDAGMEVKYELVD